MNEEMKNKAVELSDEEAEKTAGGIFLGVQWYKCPKCLQSTPYEIGNYKEFCKFCNKYQGKSL